MTTNDEEMNELYGPHAEYSDYQVGDHIIYRRAGEVIAGEVLWACAPGTSLSGGSLPLRYFVVPDAGGFPDSVWQSDIIAAR